MTAYNGPVYPLMRVEANIMEEKSLFPRSKIRQKEIFDLFAMFALQQELDKAQRDMADRLAVIPGGVEDLHAAKDLLSRLTQNILRTIPPEKLYNLQTSMKRMAYKVVMDKTLPFPESDDIVIRQNDFDALAHAAHEFKCCFCADDCNECSLGKALDHGLIRSRDRNESWANIDWNNKEDENDDD